MRRVFSLLAISALLFACTTDSDNETDTSTTTDAVSTTDTVTTDVPQTCSEVASATELASVFTATAPTLDGVAEGAWACLPSVELEVTANMVYTPEGAPVGKAYPGVEKTKIMMKSVYTATDVYFLLSWDDPTKDLARYPWEKKADGSWAQKLNKDSSGHENTYYEDKVAVQWNINSAKFSTQGCFASCHAAVSNSEPGKKYNADNELTDMWHWKSVRTEPNGQLDDKYVGFKSSGKCSGDNCRLADAKTDGGYKDNKFASFDAACLADPDGSLSLPCFMGPAGSELYTEDEPALFAADMVKFVDTFKTGDLVSGMTTAPFVGGRGDVTTSAAYASGKWTLEIKRALTTPAGAAEDVQFSDLTKTYEFGLAVFDNTQINHAAHGGVLKFTFRAK